MTSGDEPPRNMYVALIQLAKGRRGRTLIISAVFVVVLVGLVFQTSAEVGLFAFRRGLRRVAGKR
jgi:hypothetical protein